MARVTAKQMQVLDYLTEYRRKKGYAPSVREVSAHFGWTSVRAASDHLSALERKGFIERDRGVARGLRIVGLDNDLEDTA